jgi:hypothetical protein
MSGRDASPDRTLSMRLASDSSTLTSVNARQTTVTSYKQCAAAEVRGALALALHADEQQVPGRAITSVLLASGAEAMGRGFEPSGSSRSGTPATASAELDLITALARMQVSRRRWAQPSYSANPLVRCLGLT